MARNLIPSELRKYDWRPEVFVTKLKEKTPFELMNGKKVVLVNAKGIDKILRSGTNKQLLDLRLTDGKGNVYKLSDIVKSKEFGGKGEGSGTLVEDMELQSLKKQMNEVKTQTGKAFVPIRIGNVTYKAFDVVSTPGTPKSDFPLVDVDGKEIAWISHKKGKRARDFQQWGGVTQKGEPLAFSHKETKKFADEVKSIFPDGIPQATTVARKIKDRNLKMMSVYGVDFGKAFGRQNVTLMLQGPVKLAKSGSNYIITANHVHLNGEDMVGEYEPVFMAIYKGDRDNFGIKGARVVISPIGSRPINYMV